MISGIILTKNEEKNIEECIKCLNWCDEIIVIDDFSQDKTVQIARKMGAKVFQSKLNQDFSKQRNFGLEKAKGDWILFLDADERISPDLASEIQNKIKTQKDKILGFYFRRIDYFISGWLSHGEIGGWGRGFNFLGGVKLLRLAKKNSGLWRKKVDEIWEVNGKTQILKNPLLHYSHINLKDTLEKINSRSTLNASLFYEKNKKIFFGEWFKPLLKFVKNYFLLLGFLDGTKGFVFAMLMSLHSFLVRGKHYLLMKNANEEKINNSF